VPWGRMTRTRRKANTLALTPHALAAEEEEEHTLAVLLFDVAVG
jgi:hypothetical protein